MIRYNLVCELDHTFEGWFRNSEDFEVQKAVHQIECPVCSSTDVSKMLMAPAVSTSRRKENQVVPAPVVDGEASAAPKEPASAATANTDVPEVPSAPVREAALLPQDVRQKEIVAALRHLRAKMIENSDNVGKSFAEEARKIHYGDAEERAIHGETTPQDAADLLDEGISVLPLPVLPDDKN